MQIQAFAVFDEKASCYDKPFFMPTWAMAKRMFGDAVNQVDTAVSKHPADYKLYGLGTFDVESGMLEGTSTPTFICHGSDFVEPERVPMLTEVKNVR